MKKQRLIMLLVITVGALFLIVEFSPKEEAPKEYIHLTGGVFGTTYSIIYFDAEQRNFSEDITKKLAEVNVSLSTYDPNSVLSKINNNVEVDIDTHFKTVYNKAVEISELTGGAFDITVGPLVRYWGFGFDARSAAEKESNTFQIDSLLQLTGYKKIHLQGNKLTKDDLRIKLDASAIAKGYGVDVVASLLKDKGVTNYMVEIGGEIVCSGISPSNQKWKVGVDKPIDDPMALKRELQTILHLSNGAMATSGSYRQFYYKGDKRFSHTINPLKGRPVDHRLLSTTVIAPSCMEADALATACMVLGVEQSLRLASTLPNVEVYLIYESDDKTLQTKQSAQFSTYLQAPPTEQ